MQQRFMKLHGVYPLSGNIYNVLDQEYITDALDGANHDWKTAYGIFYGFGRTFNVRLKVNF